MGGYLHLPHHKLFTMETPILVPPLASLRANSPQDAGTAVPTGGEHHVLSDHVHSN